MPVMLQTCRRMIGARSKVVHMMMGQAFKIPHVVDPGRNLVQPSRDRLPLSHHANRAVTGYDEAITDAISKQLLINIARAHQHQPIHFTGVSNIAATFEFRVTAGIAPPEGDAQ